MSIEPCLWSLDRLIQSDWQVGQRVVDEITAQLARYAWSEPECFGVSLAVTEAVVNAIRHGNRQDTSKQVHVVCRLNADRVRIEISDQGTGFDPCLVPDPTEPDRLEVPTGRGLLLMRCYMTVVEFNECGNKVVLEKHRANGATPH